MQTHTYKYTQFTVPIHAYAVYQHKMQTHKDNKMSYSLFSPHYRLYTDTNKYCNILLKMHISSMFSPLRVCSCQNHGPKLSVRRLSWGRPLRLKQLPCLAGNVFTVFVPLRCTACLIHHNLTKATAVMQLQYVSIVWIQSAAPCAGVHPGVCHYTGGGRATWKKGKASRCVGNKMSKNYICLLYVLLFVCNCIQQCISFGCLSMASSLLHWLVAIRFKCNFQNPHAFCLSHVT